MWDRKVKHMKQCPHEILLSFIINVQRTDAYFHYTECGMTKLLQESSIAKLNMDIKLIEWVLNILDTYKKVNCSDKNSIERPPLSLSTVLPW